MNVISLGARRSLRAVRDAAREALAAITPALDITRYSEPDQAVSASVPVKRSPVVIGTTTRARSPAIPRNRQF
jgi:hypothetical protein